MFWLREDVVLLSPSRVGLDLLLDQVELFRKRLLKANRLLREQSRNPIYAERYSLLISIPGIGVNTAMCLLTEIDDIARFNNQREFASYLGLIPTSHSSGDITLSCRMITQALSTNIGPIFLFPLNVFSPL